MKNFLKKTCAFTLAEVLITLAIIGVVAALTIPTVVRNYQEKQTLVRFQKAYSQLSQAYQMAQVEHGAPDTWGWGSYGNNADAARIMNNYLLPYLKVIKNCGTANGCFAPAYMNLNKTTSSYDLGLRAFPKVVLADGTSMLIVSRSNNCTLSRRGTDKRATNVCAELIIDINGTAQPNVMGRDLFYLFYTKYGIIGWGMPYVLSGRQDLTVNCNIDKSVTGFENGISCASWILVKGNMDYLHKTVSW